MVKVASASVAVAPIRKAAISESESGVPAGPVASTTMSLGGVTSGSVVSTTVIVAVAVPVLPSPSVAVKVTVVTPRG